MPAVAPPPAAPRPRPIVRPRVGGALGRLLAGLVAVAGIAALVGLVAVQNGWLVLQRGEGIASLSSAGDVAMPALVGAPPADSLTGGAAPATPVPLPAVGDSVTLPTLDPADSARSTADSLAGLGTATSSERDAAAVAATSAELATLRSRLTVPVRGVAAAALRDDYEQARGGGSRQHEALDILSPRGTPVVAATDGRIVKLFDSAQGGLTVYQADASDRFVLLYGHLDRYEPGLAEGAAVRQGQVIGYVGSTGNASPEAPHLHFGVARSADPARWWSSGTPVNPYPLLKR